MTVRAVSYGGGVQSTALLVLARFGSFHTDPEAAAVTECARLNWERFYQVNQPSAECDRLNREGE